MRCCQTRIGPGPSHLIARAMATIKGNVKASSAQAITRSRSALQRTAPAEPGGAMGIPRSGASIPDLLSPFRAKFGERSQEQGESLCQAWSSGVAQHYSVL